MPRRKKKRKNHKRRFRSATPAPVLAVECNDFVRLRHSNEAVGQITRINAKNKAVLIRFKNGCFGWFRTKHINKIEQTEFDDASSDFEVSRRAASQTPAKSNSPRFRRV